MTKRGTERVRSTQRFPHPIKLTYQWTKIPMNWLIWIMTWRILQLDGNKAPPCKRIRKVRTARAMNGNAWHAFCRGPFRFFLWPQWKLRLMTTYRHSSPNGVWHPDNLNCNLGSMISNSRRRYGRAFTAEWVTLRPCGWLLMCRANIHGTEAITREANKEVATSNMFKSTVSRHVGFKIRCFRPPCS